jgi:hypothetical protein
MVLEDFPIPLTEARFLLLLLFVGAARAEVIADPDAAFRFPLDVIEKCRP